MSLLCSVSSGWRDRHISSSVNCSTTRHRSERRTKQSCISQCSFSHPHSEIRVVALGRKEGRLVTGKRKVEIEMERAGRGRRATGSEGDKWSRNWGWGKATMCKIYCSRFKPKRNRWLYSVLIPPQDYSSFQESRVFPQDLRLISGIQNLFAVSENQRNHLSKHLSPPSQRQTHTNCCCKLPVSFSGRGLSK